jgi:hypothetical protein
MAFEVNNQVIRDAVARLGWPAPASGALSLLGVRGAVPWADAPEDGKYYLSLQPNTPDQWNDTIGFFGTEFGIWLGTVDPGLPYTTDPLHAAGCAHLQNGVWQFTLGSHKGHEALVQAAPVTITRDADRDASPERHELVETGYFGINIHASGDSATVGEYSAGCQVIRGGWSSGAWETFLETVKASARGVWPYYLMDGAELAPAE